MRILTALLCVFVVAGCQNAPNSVPDDMLPEGTDLSHPEDPIDLAKPAEGWDLSRPTEPPDLLGADLSGQPDLAIAVDLAIPTDLAISTDLTIPTDLTNLANPDLATHDLAHADLSSLPDLSKLADLSHPADLSTPPDMAPSCGNTPYDVTTKAVSGIITLNGAQPTSACGSSDRATVKLDDDARNYHFSFVVPCTGTASPFAWSGSVYPGVYKITVAGGYSDLPAEPYLVDAARTINAPTTFTFDVVAKAVSGVITLNGAQPTSACGSSDRATVKLDDNARNYHFSFVVPCTGTASPFAWSGTVFPGVYNITVVGGYSNLPNQPYQVAAAQTINAPTTFNSDVVAVAVSGVITLNGAQPTSACGSSDRATVKLEDNARNYHFSFVVPCTGTASPFAWSGTVYPGVYNITVTGGYSTLPNQPYRVAAAQTINAPTTFNSDVVAVAVSGVVTLNGAQPTSACGSSDRATVKLDDNARNYHFSFVVPCTGTASPFAWSGTVFPGVYDISVTGGYSTLPNQPYQVATAQTINAPATFTFDVVSVAVSGIVTQNGAQPTSACGSSDRASIKLDDDSRNYHFTFVVPCTGTASPFAWSGSVYPGVYKITVAGVYSTLPMQPYLVDAARTISAPTTFTWDVLTRNVCGTLTVDGAQPTSACGSSDRATVQYDDNARNYHFNFIVPCTGTASPFNYTGTLYPGVYRVSVTGGYSNIPPQPYLEASALTIP